jgi:hypothetical protein
MSFDQPIVQTSTNLPAPRRATVTGQLINRLDPAVRSLPGGYGAAAGHLASQVALFNPQADADVQYSATLGQPSLSDLYGYTHTAIETGDLNGDGVWTANEVSNNSPLNRMRLSQTEFNATDLNNDGKIEGGELAARIMLSDGINGLFNSQTQADGVISRDEAFRAKVFVNADSAFAKQTLQQISTEQNTVTGYQTYLQTAETPANRRAKVVLANAAQTIAARNLARIQQIPAFNVGEAFNRLIEEDHELINGPTPGTIPGTVGTGSGTGSTNGTGNTPPTNPPATTNRPLGNDPNTAIAMLLLFALMMNPSILQQRR